jgi:UDP-glucose 4-epimerase
MKVLVTGGAGFIGTHLCKLLLEQGYHVTILDDLSTGSSDHVLPGINLVKDSVISPHSIQSVFDGVDTVFHLAALASVPKSIEDPTRTFLVNVVGTVNVLSLSVKAKVRKFVFISSSSVYGVGGDEKQKECSPTNPLSPYAMSKLVGEQYCDLYGSLYGLQTVYLRYFNVYGEGSSPYGLVIPIFINLAKKNMPLPVYGDGEQTRDFIFVDDAVHAALFLSKDVFKGVYNAGSGRSVSVNQLAKMIIELTGSKSRIEYHEARKGDALRTLADINKIKEAGFQPKWSLEDGLRRMVG